MTRQHPDTPSASATGLDDAALAAACAEPADRHAAWRFAAAFARDWGARPLTAGDGAGESELQAAQARLGLPLPAALREAYLLLGRRPDLTSRHDTLLEPGELYLDGDRGVLVYRIENQSCAYWGIRIADLGHPDPPVVVRGDEAAPVAAHWQPWLGHVSTEVVQILLAESLSGDEELTGLIWQPSADDRAVLEGGYRRLPLPVYPPGPGNPGSRWYAGPGVLLCDDSGVIQVRGRTRAAFEAARAAFAGAEWLGV